ncbi:PhnA domain-containing protein [Gallaecimonas kandeliae]|uniref:PhnA domain-containing protein n=1 Tax=Gallaecimonas kandeliae TaxID=3029055 RepID=UPI002649297D|nr:PhnA domain-containing protein [Gallaecimonas kandeliae]WKE67018.1 PhnA domain-containing protein [Gallaecimonas kandeliae]
MSLEKQLMDRAGGQCELCGATEGLAPYQVPASPDSSSDCQVLLCPSCLGEAEAPTSVNHWRCLNDSMWSQVPAVQVMAYRQLKRLSAETWAQDLLDMLYLDEEVKKWADAGLAAEEDDSEPTLDSNGARLLEGDDVTLIKDLEVKGGGFTAKRGTLVKGIRLTNNPKHIEGKVNGVQIVLVAEYLKKA